MDQTSIILDKIKKVQLQGLKKLDLGKHGIRKEMSNFNDIVKELSNCTNLIELNLGNYMWNEGKMIESLSGTENNFENLCDILEIIPPNLEILHLCRVGMINASTKDLKRKKLSLKRIELSDNKINQKAVDFLNLSELTFIGLSNNRITELTIESIFPNKLKCLFLMNNPLSIFDSMIFTNKLNLKLLDLSGSNLNEITGIRDLANLEILYLYNMQNLREDNNFKDIIFGLPKLRILDFANNPAKSVNAVEYRSSLFKSICSDPITLVKYLPENITRKYNLKCTPFNSENVNELNEKECKKLFDYFNNCNYSYASFNIYNHIMGNGNGCLDLGNCNLSSIDLLPPVPEATQSSGSLNQNDIERISNTTSNLFNLLSYFRDEIKILNLGPDYYSNLTYNENSKIINKWRSNAELQQSINNLQSNQFSSFEPLNLTFLSNLRQIHMRKCKLDHGVIVSGDTLNFVDLSINSISNINLAFLNYLNVRILLLNDNKIANIQFGNSSHNMNLNIDELELSNNKLEKFSFNNGIIRNLNLSCNSFKSIDIASIDLSYHHSGDNSSNNELYLCRNIITSVPRSVIENWEGLRLDVLDLTQNPIHNNDCPDYVLTSKKYKDLVAFFPLQLKSKDEIFQTEYHRIFKLVILGDPGVGKSSLVKHLSGKHNSADVLHKWVIDKNIEVNIFDFDNIIYETELHHYWLDNDTVYLILWNSDSANRDSSTNMKYWLDSIKNNVYDLKSTSIFLVQSNVNNYYDDKIYIDKEILEEYNINDIYYMGIVDKEDMVSLEKYKIKAKLIELFNEKSNMSQKRSEKFYETRAQLLNIKGIDQILDEKGDATTVVMSRYLDEIRYIHLINDGSKNIIVEPNDYYNQFISFINNEIKCNAKLWIPNQNTLKNPICRDFINILENYKVIHPHPTVDSAFIVPRYLDCDDPIEDLLELFENDLNEDALVLQLPFFYYRKTFEALLFYIFRNSAYSVKHYWLNGLFSIYSDGGQSNLAKIFIRCYSETKLKTCRIKITIQKSETQGKIFKDLTNFITGLNFRGLQKHNIGPDEMFLNNLGFTYGNSKVLKNISEIKAGLENNDNSFSPFSKYFSYSTSISPAKNVFISYSHNNADYLYKLRKHLAPLRRSNLINDWVDTEIQPGDKWEDKILENLNKADIFIVLLSADLVASNYSFNVELNTAFNMMKLGRTRIIPVYIQPFDIFGMPSVKNGNLLEFEILPKKEEKLVPISLWANQDEAFQVVAQKIRETMQY